MNFCACIHNTDTESLDTSKNSYFSHECDFFVHFLLQDGDQVSAWRRLFVANEWNELQVTRKLNFTLLLTIALLLLEIVGLKNLARFDTSSSLSDLDGTRGDFSPVFRFAVGCSVYIAVGESWHPNMFIVHPRTSGYVSSPNTHHCELPTGKDTPKEERTAVDGPESTCFFTISETDRNEK